jgi:DNA-damage-inducible protein D
MTDQIRMPEPGEHPSRYWAALENANPFDAGRITCAQGGEDRWSARWLQEQLGYPTWQHFEPVVERAKQTAHNEGFNIKTLFTVQRENSGGRPRIDYQVTRYAAYLIAMNGHPSKPAVAAAQHYFAVKTRQAEVAPDPSSFDLMRMMIDRLEASDRKAEEARALAQKAEARLDAIEGHHDWFSALGYARVHGIQNTSTQFLNRVGRQASSVAKANDIEPAKVPHPLFGEVNSYPSWIWDLAFAGFEASA